MTALAFSNNDIAVFAWVFPQRLPGCLGFAVYRGEAAGERWTALPALARFNGVDPAEKLTTEQAPVQKFWWKDLGAKRGSTHRYRIVPLGGAPGALAPLDGVEPLLTNAVTLTPQRGAYRAVFNRGIISSQAVSAALGSLRVKDLLRRIRDPKDAMRQTLSGDLMGALTALLDSGEGALEAALYELDDPEGLEASLTAHPEGRHVVLGNSRTKQAADGDAAARARLKAAGLDVTDRILASGHIPHNKFLWRGAAVLTGSTNWTTTGLCTQTNNALLIDSAEVAGHYDAYWQQLKADSAAGSHQGAALRTWARTHNDAVLAKPVPLDGGTIQPLFAPSTHGALAKPPHERPADLEYLFGLIGSAKQAVLFLAFDPGNNSILDAAGAALRANPSLFVRGALTSPQRALNFAAALRGGDPVLSNDTALIGESGSAEPDYRVIPAGAVRSDDAFGAWEAELANAGFAIIHDKIVVIDPFSPGCVVATGSHNLGYRASHNNDENFVVIRGHRALAEAYACHVLDVYDHYAWRYWLHKDPARFGRPLDATDAWQDRYMQDGKPNSPELRFWLSAA